MRELLHYLQYWDEAVSVLICYWCMHRMSFMTWRKTPCIDIISIALLGGGSIMHAVSPFYDWHIDPNYSDPLLWTGIAGWISAPSLRKWAIYKDHRWITWVLTKKA